MQQIKRPLEAGIKKPHVGLFFFKFFARVVLRRADSVRFLWGFAVLRLTWLLIVLQPLKDMSQWIQLLTKCVRVILLLVSWLLFIILSQTVSLRC